MRNQLVRVQAPSNIALIKYMGKKDASRNIPENSSISMTLNQLRSEVEVEIQPALQSVNQSVQGNLVQWVPEVPRSDQGLGGNFKALQLKEADISRVLKHVERVRRELPALFDSVGLECHVGTEQWTLRTANTFPMASGIASSASSFAALTLATAVAGAHSVDKFERVWAENSSFRCALARISRLGSGSSCRSFGGPWVFWENEDVFPLATEKMPRMAHFVILIKSEPKAVSSSQAHALVQTSPLWKDRVDRVENRARLLLAALERADLTNIARIAWSEAWEMHSLFHTCVEPFSYWEPQTIDGLHWFSKFFRAASASGLSPHDPPPIVTLDAGPNIHVIVEKKDREIWRSRLKDFFGDTVILEDGQGIGASILGVQNL